MSGGEVSYSAAIIQHLERLAAAFIDGDEGLTEWARGGAKSPAPLFGGEKGDPRFEEAAQLIGKFEETSKALVQIVDHLQKALMGVSDTSLEIRDALKGGDQAAVDVAIALLPSRVDDVLKQPLKTEKPT